VGRTAVFPEHVILDAATRHVARGGPNASVASLARSLGAPSGSIYYRFANRDALVAEVWLRAVRSFQQGFLAALDDPDPDRAALAAASYVPQWCGEHLDEAIVLHRYRLEDLVAVFPAALLPDRDVLNGDLHRALRRHARQRYGHTRGNALERTTFALVSLPGASVRPFLDRREAPPAWVVEAIGTASLSVLRATQAT
jgi:AcrR family transcriptional regulator